MLRGSVSDLQVRVGRLEDSATDPLEQRIVILGRGEAMSARPETIDDYLATVSDEKRAALGYCGGQFGRPRPGPKSASAIGFQRSVSAAGCS